ncbi:uncharacterized protein LOC120681720 isoform X2 [Panicum virgatum]|uniref:uncharacterized protein LOC120681720 isoform X2 n=1 Tax=Panicum virgatum TaxID=38727 RepID=UPI0019D658D8|nr:uncharacterized protein LOC120681720 isoform X2 [Panicum virgatum]
MNADGIERRECTGKRRRCYSTRDATVPRVLFTRWEGCEGERVAARVGGAGNAGRGASPTVGKREGHAKAPLEVIVCPSMLLKTLAAWTAKSMERPGL